MSLFLVLIPFCLLVGCKARIGAVASITNKENNDPLPEFVRDYYRHDAAALALRDLDAGKSEPVSVADVPRQSYLDHYLRLGKLFTHLHKISNIPDLTKVHIDKRPDLQRVKVILRSDATFKERWQKGFSSTENLYLNQLMAKYRMAVKNYREGPEGPQVELVSPEYLNTREFARLLRGVNGIRDAREIDHGIGGNNIRSIHLPDGNYRVSLIRGHGDCNPECSMHTFYNFLISPDGKTIKYEGFTDESNR